MAHIPFGYRVENGRALIDIREKMQLERLYTAFSQGNTFAKSLECSGIKRSPGCARRLLENETYRGTDFYPKLLDDRLIDAVREELGKREVHHRSGWKRRKRIHVRTRFAPPSSLSPVPDETPMDYISRMYTAVKDAT